MAAQVPDVPAVPAAPEPPSPAPSLLSSLLPPNLRQSLDTFSQWHEQLGLAQPGLAEGLHREVHQDVFLNQFAFSGMKAGLGRTFSANPLFQVSHAFTAGSSQAPPWQFLTMYGTDDVHPSSLSFLSSVLRVAVCVGS
jgi:mitochondrial import receptor subunit TOM40